MLAGLTVIALPALPTRSQESNGPDLTQSSLEDLMNIKRNLGIEEGRENLSGSRGYLCHFPG